MQAYVLSLVELPLEAVEPAPMMVISVRMLICLVQCIVITTAMMPRSA